MIKKKVRLDVMIYTLAAVFYIWMAAQIPYAHDDWDWGLSNGIYQLIHANLNARYVGNFFVVIMTRSEVAKTAIMGICYFAIPFFLADCAVKNQQKNKRELRLAAFLLGNVLIFTMNGDIWRQTYGWVSGFANYVISIAFLIPWIYEIDTAFSENAGSNVLSSIYDAIYFGLSFLGQLFLENLAIYLVFLGCFICVVYFIRFHKIPKKIA